MGDFTLARTQEQNPIASALVVCLPQGQSLALWRSVGTLERDWAVHATLGSRFERVLVVTHGDAAEHDALPQLEIEGTEVSIVCNEDGLDHEAFVASATARVCEILAFAFRPGSSVIVKADQMVGCDLARPITEGLRDANLDARLVARAGSCWSRFLARECGPDSTEAIEAGDDEAEICAIADVVISADSGTLDDLSWRYNLDRSRAVVTPDCIIADADPTSERASGRVVSVGGLRSRTRMDMIIEAVAQLGDQLRPTVQLQLIGDGPDRTALENLARARDVNLEIVPSARHDEVMGLISQAALMIQADDHIGDTRFIYEAQAVGTPCVVADTPGLGATVEHGVTGLRCPQDVAALAHMMTGIIEDASWAEAMALAAARRVRDRYSTDRVAKILARAYEDSMHRRTRDAA